MRSARLLVFLLLGALLVASGIALAAAWRPAAVIASGQPTASSCWAEGYGEVSCKLACPKGSLGSIKVMSLGTGDGSPVVTGFVMCSGDVAVCPREDFACAGATLEEAVQTGDAVCVGSTDEWPWGRELMRVECSYAPLAAS